MNKKSVNWSIYYLNNNSIALFQTIKYLEMMTFYYKKKQEVLQLKLGKNN